MMDFNRLINLIFLLLVRQIFCSITACGFDNGSGGETIYFKSQPGQSADDCPDIVQMREPARRERYPATNR